MHVIVNRYIVPVEFFLFLSEFMRKPRHRNSTRDRENAELSTLRGLVSELEAHVSTLRRGLQTHNRSRSAWQCFSERQARGRQKAENTNRVLNSQVQSNADWIQRLWELLHEKRRVNTTFSLGRIAKLQQKMEDDLVLNQLKQRAEAAVPQLSSVFAANGIQFPNGDGGFDLDKDIWSHVQTGDLQSTLVCVRRVPFAMHSTSSVIWETLSNPDKSFASEENSGHDVTPIAHVLERLPNFCAMKFRGEIRRELDESMHLDYYAVVHRVEMDAPYNASVFVWQSFSKIGDEGIEYRDTMWTAVTRCPSGGLESVVTVVSQSQLETVDRIGDASGLLAALMPTTDVCIKSILSSADNLLLDESLSHNSGETLVQTSDV